MRSTKTNQPQQSVSFWDQLEQDIDKIGNRAKDKFLNYELRQYKTVTHNPQSGMRVQVPPPPNLNLTLKLNVKKSHRTAIHRNSHQDNSGLELMAKSVDPQLSARSMSIKDRRQLQKLSKQQDGRRQAMQNRLAYLKQDKSRKNKTIELAKKKFQHIITVRTKSFKQKQLIRKKLASIDNQQRNLKDEMVRQVKNNKHRRNMSLQNWKSIVQATAKQIRTTTIHNQSFVSQVRSKYKQTNARKVSETKKSLQRSRSIVSQARQKKINQTKIYHKQQLSNRLHALNQQKRNNQIIFSKLKQETQKINKWKSRAQKQIEQYRSYLGATTKRSVVLGRSKQSETSLKSFYITNF